MMSTVFRLVLKLSVLAWSLWIFDLPAIDGDLEYTPPYIMVDPETGQIKTVNPGPRPKAHQAQNSTQTSPAAGGGQTPGGASPPVAASAAPSPVSVVNNGPDTRPPLIVLFACLLIVVSGFFISRFHDRRMQNISTESGRQNR